MNNRPTLYLLCGKMAAGKSTLAAEISRAPGILKLSEDDWLARLYPGEIADVPTYINLSQRLMTVVESLVIDVLSTGTSVVLDFPANTVKQRAFLVQLAEKANAAHELHYLDVSDAECKKQLLKRASENPDRAATDTLDMFDAISRYFEPPSEHEGLNVVRVKQDAH